MTARVRAPEVFEDARAVAIETMMRVIVERLCAGLALELPPF